MIVTRIRPMTARKKRFENAMMYLL